MSGAPLLDIRGLTKRFGGLVALDDVSLAVPAGSIHAVIGPNGSGKTTLFNIVSGVYAPDGGVIDFLARPIAGRPTEVLARRGLARTFQNTRLFASMSVLENVLVVRHRAGPGLLFGRAEDLRARAILEAVGLADVADHPAASLPQGLRRLLEIAKALALDPRLVLLDEPHGGLNHAETDRLIGVIERIHSAGITILLIEHEMDVVMRLARSITVLNFGRVLARGTPAEIQRNEAVLEAYLGRVRITVAAPAAPAPAARPILELRDLTVRFGDSMAVRGASLRVEPGEIVTLLGSNGAGKSTTLKAICGLVPTQAGEVRFLDASLRGVPTERLARRGIALVPERRRLFGALTVIENLKIGGYGLPAATIAARIDEVLALFPLLRRLAGVRAFALSGGEQQMLAIGRALMSAPKLLLLDEPSLGLAPLLVEQVFAKLVEVNRGGTAILLVEQNARMALSVAHRGYVLASGRVVAEGPAALLAEDERVQHAYLGGAAA